MSISELIKKLQSEHGSNGVYYTLKTEYSKLKGKVEIRNTSPIGSAKERIAREDAREIFQWLMGFLWGLQAMNYTSEAEHDQLANELIQIANGKQNDAVSGGKERER